MLVRLRTIPHLQWLHRLLAVNRSHYCRGLTFYGIFFGPITLGSPNQCVPCDCTVFGFNMLHLSRLQSLCEVSPSQLSLRVSSSSSTGCPLGQCVSDRRSDLCIAFVPHSCRIRAATPAVFVQLSGFALSMWQSRSIRVAFASPCGVRVPRCTFATVCVCANCAVLNA